MFEWNDGTALYHYGIPGMKWGVRRFQNPDGTWTEAGKERRRLQRIGDSVIRTVDKRNRTIN